jgi:hypothetical protein
VRSKEDETGDMNQVRKSAIKSIFCAITLLATVSCSSQQSEKTKMETAENKSEGIFLKGEPAPADYFTGKVHLQMLAQKTEKQ